VVTNFTNGFLVACILAFGRRIGQIEMAKITKSYESDIDLTVFTVVGEITFDEVWDQTRIFYLSGKPSKLALWDFTSGTVEPISSQQMNDLAKRTMKISARIEGGKGAFLVPKDIDYGMTRVFQVFSEEEGFPLEVEIFRDMNAAQKWLMSGQ
jgi:hypothetical protein